MHRGWNTHPLWLWKRPIYLWIGFRLATHLEVTKALSGNVGRKISFLQCPVALPELAGTSQERAYILFWSPDSFNCHPGDTSRSLVPQDCILTCVKSCCLRTWLPVSLKLGANWDHSIWNTLGTPSTTGTYWNLSRINQTTLTRVKIQETTKS